MTAPEFNEIFMDKLSINFPECPEYPALPEYPPNSITGSFSGTAQKPSETHHGREKKSNMINDRNGKHSNKLKQSMGWHR